MSRSGGFGGRGSLGAALVLVAALGLGACAAGPRFDGREYHGKDVAFRIGPLPSGYRRISSDESLLAFRDDGAGTSLALNARCRLDGDDVPLTALVQHLFLQFTAREELARRSFQLDGREALEVQTRASLDGVSRHFVVTVFKKNDCVYDFLLVGNQEAVLDARVLADYRALVEGFATLPSEGGPAS